MKRIGIIPARMKSGRFPGKPLAKIHGIPMVGHCYFRSKMSKSLEEIYVATPDKEVFDYIESIGGKSIMTLDTHEMCTDRVAEAALKVEKELGGKLDIVVNIQGDQPMVFPEMIDAVTKPLIDNPSLVCSTMMDKVTSDDDFRNPNRIKIVVDEMGFAMYMSREPIPSAAKCKKQYARYKHIALIPFRRDFLIEFTKYGMTPLESVESVDYLRAMEKGVRIKMILTEDVTETVDNQEDLEKVEKMMRGDRLMPLYRDRALQGVRV